MEFERTGKVKEKRTAHVVVVHLGDLPDEHTAAFLSRVLLFIFAFFERNSSRALSQLLSHVT